MLPCLPLLLLSLYCLWAPPRAHALQVFDCEADRTTYEVLDLTDTQKCPEKRGAYLRPVRQQMRILHTDSQQRVSATRCRVLITRFVTSCHAAFHSSYGPQMTMWREPFELDPQRCATAAKNGTLAWGRQEVMTVTIDMPTRHRFFSRGHADGRGYVECEGFYSGDKYFHSAYEQTLVEAEVGEVAGTISRDTGTFTFEGVTAPAWKGYFRDGIVGTVVWDKRALNNSCRARSSQMYVGSADLFRRRTPLPTQSLTGSIVLVDSPGTGQFAGFHLRQGISHCGHSCFATQVPGVLVCPISKGEPEGDFTFLPGSRDLTSIQFLTQFGFLHLRAGQRAQDRLDTVMGNICQLELADHRARLQELAGTNNPYALLDRYGWGHTVQVAGTAAYVLKCAKRNATRADYGNCTQEIPVLLDDKVRFADPFTFIVKDFPTLIPCSPIMPVRFHILGQWYCAAPGLRPCSAPKQLGSTLPGPEVGDFTRGMGMGVFTAEQLAKHKQFWRAATSRKAVLSRATSAATGDLSRMELGLSIPPIGMSEILDRVNNFIFPILPSLGHMWSIISGAFLLFTIVKFVVESFIRMLVIYHERGCGAWILLGLCNLAYQIGHTPVHLVKAALNRMKEPFQPNKLPALMNSNGYTVETQPKRHDDYGVGEAYPQQYGYPNQELDEMREEEEGAGYDDEEGGHQVDPRHAAVAGGSHIGYGQPAPPRQ